MTVHKRFQQFTVGLLAVLSLLVSSASAACTCSHHQGQAKSEISLCHSDSEMSEMTDVHVSDIESPNTNLASKADCICAEMTQKVFAKPEALKLKKQAALISRETSVSIAVVQPNKAIRSSFIKPTYFSDSFYNLSFSRGPPRL